MVTEKARAETHKEAHKLNQQETQILIINLTLKKVHKSLEQEVKEMKVMGAMIMFMTMITVQKRHHMILEIHNLT